MRFTDPVSQGFLAIRSSSAAMANIDDRCVKTSPTVVSSSTCSRRLIQVCTVDALIWRSLSEPSGPMMWLRTRDSYWA